jgi:hypothetical protein
MTDEVVIRIMGLANPAFPGYSPCEQSGQFVISLDADARKGRGTIKTTPDMAKAARFKSTEAAVAYWKTQSQTTPFRCDGRPNRPLTAYTVSVLPYTYQRQMPSRPGYWMHEEGGVLAPAVSAYLAHEPLTTAQIVAIRLYLRQWMADPGWKGPLIDPLRTAADEIASRTDVTRWLELAEAAGIDPL